MIEDPLGTYITDSHKAQLNTKSQTGKMVIRTDSPEFGIQNDGERMLLAAYNISILIASLLGDTLIVIATTKYKAIKLHRVHVVIIQHLAVADLLISILSIFPGIVAIITEGWFLGEFLCRLQFLGIWFFAVVLALTCCLTTSKLMTVKLPFYCRMWSARNAHFVCLSIWVLSLLNLVGTFLSFGLNNDLLFTYLSQNAKRASARKDTGLDQSLFYVQLFRLRINII